MLFLLKLVGWASRTLIFGARVDAYEVVWMDNFVTLARVDILNYVCVMDPVELWF